MSVELRWSPVGSVVTLLSTELNSLASNARAIGSAIDPTTDRYIFGDLELNVTFGSAPAADTTYIELYFVRTVDGTNYADGSSSLAPKPPLLVAVFALDNQTANRKVVPEVTIPPTLYKALLINKSGLSFPASGSTVKLLPYSSRGV